MYDVGFRLAVDCGPAGTFLNKSAIPLEQDVEGNFSGRSIGARKVIGYYYRSLVYTDLGRRKQLKKTYGESVMTMSVEHFSR